MTDQERQERMEKLFEKMLNMEMTNREIYEQCRNVAHKPMTNEEWLRSCTTEELVGAIYEWHSLGYTRHRIGLKLNPPTEILEWLKEKHDGNMG